MTILVTGAAGFIGSHVCRHLLSRGEKVLGLDNLNDYYSTTLKRDRIAELEHNGFRFIEVDFAEETALAEGLRGTAVDRIVHLGAQPGVSYSIRNPRSYVRANLVGHANILELARQHNVAHLVYASSSSVYGGNTKMPFSEEDRVDHPLSLYAATKKADELLSETYANIFRIPQTGLRFFTVYGPWGRPDMAVWKFTNAILRGDPIDVYGGGAMRRDFTYIDDIVAGLVAALDRPPSDDGLPKSGGSQAPHRIYNIGNNRSEPLDRLITLIEEACGRKAQRRLLPVPPGEVLATYADIDSIAAELGYRASTSIDEGIPRFVQWYRNYSGL